MMMIRSVLFFACGAAATSLAFAQVPAEGRFTAARDCPALQSIRKGTNPGETHVAAGQSYRLMGKNKEAVTHYWIEVPGAKPPQRWVAITCGSITGGQAASPPKQTEKSEKRYVLALSWQPAFCEGLPDKKECRAQTPSSFEATHFTLHGLWPQPRRAVYCGVEKAAAAADSAHRWEDLPEVVLQPDTRTALDQVMPGTQSLLERHEWIKHGTCYPAGTAETYFKDAIRIMGEINTSPVQSFVAAHVGQTIQSSELRAKFDEAFGSGAGDRVRVACKTDDGRQLIAEVTLGLGGDIPAGTPLTTLLAGSEPTDPGCPNGIIDPVGLQ
jgi:ribonuclease T2